MFFVEILLLLNFTVLCAIMLTIWRIRDHVERLVDARTGGGAGPSVTASSTATTSAKPPAA